MQLCTIFENRTLVEENMLNIKETKYDIIKDFNIVYYPNKHPDIDEAFIKFKFENFIEKRDLNKLIQNLLFIKETKIKNYNKLSLEYHIWNINVIYYNMLKCITVNDIRKYCRTINNNFYFTAMNWVSIKHIFDLLTNSNDKIVCIEKKININDDNSTLYIEDIKNKLNIRIRILEHTINKNERKLLDKIDNNERKINKKIDKLYTNFNILSIAILVYFIYNISYLHFAKK